MARSGGVSARDRARQAKIALDKKRAEEMRRVEAACLTFFKAEESAEAARAELVRADQGRAAAVQELVALGVSVADVSDMLGVEAKEVRMLAKQAVPSEGQDALPVEPAPDAATSASTARA